MRSSRARVRISNSPAAPRPGMTSLRIVPLEVSSAISRATAVGALRRAWTCEIVATGGRAWRKLRISAVRVEESPEREGGMGVNVWVVMWRIAWGTSRRERSVRRVWIRAVEGRRVVGSEEEGVSSSEEEGCWDLSLEEGPRAMGLRRGREEKGERRGVEGVDFLMRLECAAVVWKDIVRWLLTEDKGM